MTETMNEAVNLSPDPQFSIVMPCFNEADLVGFTIPQLVEGFRDAGIALELIAVDNGSTDHTGELLQGLARQDPAVVHHRIDENIGYGNGLLEGYRLARGQWVGQIPADLQVDVESVVKLAQLAAASSSPLLFKIRRRFRLESLSRRLVSVSYNLITQLIFGRLETMDINANPKLFPRASLERMELCSTDWFLDPEIMIKAKALGMGVVELNAFSQIRVAGRSNVNAFTVWEFLRNLLSHKFGAKRRHLLVLPETPPVASTEGVSAIRENTGL